MEDWKDHILECNAPEEIKKLEDKHGVHILHVSMEEGCTFSDSDHLNLLRGIVNSDVLNTIYKDIGDDIREGLKYLGANDGFPEE